MTLRARTDRRFIRATHRSERFVLVELDAPPVPKSGDAERRRANLDVFGFALTPEEHAAIATLETGERAGKDPATDEEF